MKCLRIMEVTLYVLSALLFAAGASTFLYTEVDAKIESISNFQTRQNGYGGTNRNHLLFNGSSMSWSKIRYSYEVNGKRHSSSFSGFKLPIALNYKAGQRVKAWFAPGIPELAVISRGPSLFVLLFVILGAGFNAIRSWLKDHNFA